MLQRDYHAPLAGTDLTIFTVPFFNLDSMSHTLPDIKTHDDMMEFMLMEKGFQTSRSQELMKTKVFIL